MLPSFKFYIISIVAIFAALGIGILIGFTMNTQKFVIEQKENISEMIETQLESLLEENQRLKNNEKVLEDEIEVRDRYIELTYNHIIKNKLNGLNIAIIETNNDYVTSGIGRDLELAGAKVVNVTTINKDIVNKDYIDSFLNRFNIHNSRNPVEEIVSLITESIIRGNENYLLSELEKEGFIELLGKYDENIDYIIICGGSKEDPANRINQVDKIIVEVAENYNIPIIGVEKLNVDFSYIPKYQTLGISTVDNVDTIMGKVAMILVMQGISGNYGVKNTAIDVIPHYNFENNSY